MYIDVVVYVAFGITLSLKFYQRFHPGFIVKEYDDMRLWHLIGSLNNASYFQVHKQLQPGRFSQYLTGVYFMFGKVYKYFEFRCTCGIEVERNLKP